MPYAPPSFLLRSWCSQSVVSNLQVEKVFSHEFALIRGRRKLQNFQRNCWPRDAACVKVSEPSLHPACTQSTSTHTHTHIRADTHRHTASAPPSSSFGCVCVCCVCGLAAAVRDRCSPSPRHQHSRRICVWCSSKALGCLSGLRGLSAVSCVWVCTLCYTP